MAAATVDSMPVGRLTSLLRLQRCQGYTPVDAERLPGDLEVLKASAQCCPGLQERLRHFWAKLRRRVLRARRRHKLSPSSSSSSTECSKMWHRRRSRGDSSSSSPRCRRGHRGHHDSRSRKRSRGRSRSNCSSVSHHSKQHKSRSYKRSRRTTSSSIHVEGQSTISKQLPSQKCIRGISSSSSSSSIARSRSSSQGDVNHQPHRTGDPSRAAAAAVTRAVISRQGYTEISLDGLTRRPEVGPSDQDVESYRKRLAQYHEVDARDRRRFGEVCRRCGSTNHISRECTRYECGRLSTAR